MAKSSGCCGNGRNPMAKQAIFGGNSAGCTLPSASFTTEPSPATGNAPLSVLFTDTSTNTPTSWLWTIIGGTVNVDYVFTVGTATSQNPVIRFDTPNSYSVVLTATNACGSDDSTSADITSVFLPSVYGTVLTWLKNNTLITQSGGLISAWGDSSGAGNNSTQGTMANKPAYNAAGINSLPSADFDGIASFLDFGAFANQPSFTIFCVCKITDVSVRQYMYGNSNAAGAIASLWGDLIVNDSTADTGKLFAFNGNSDNATFMYSQTTNVAIVNNTCVCTAIRYVSGDTFIDFFINGVLVARTDIVTTSNINNANLGSFSLGRPGAFNGIYLAGSVGEFLIYSGGLSSGNILTISRGYKNQFSIP